MIQGSWRSRVLGAVAACFVLVTGEGVAARAEVSPAVRYVQSTGHTISGPFLQFLDLMGDDLLGNPLSEPMPLDGTTVQWFERGRLDLTDNNGVALAPLGRLLGPKTAAFPMTVPPAPGSAAEKIAAFYREHGGEALFGRALGPVQDNQQWYEQARLDYDPATDTVSLGPIGSEAMQSAGISPEAAQLHWVAAERAAALRRAPLPRAPSSVLVAGVPMVQTNHLPGWVELWDPARNTRGWLPEQLVGPVNPPAWLKNVVELSPVDTRARVVAWNSTWRYNAQLTLTARVVTADGAELYVDQSGELVPAKILRVPRPPAAYHPGRWIDADLREPVLITAYENDHPVYTALAVKGTPNHPTQLGTFQIWRRVANERMRSDTIGIPLGSPGSYDITGVLFTQYFTHDGAALHYNYWRSNWGYTGSHGCLGMNYDDSKFFWDWATIGTTVVTRA